MARHRIEISLLQKGRLDTGIEKIEEYKNTFGEKCKEFVLELAQRGIQVGYVNISSLPDQYSGALVFERSLTGESQYGAKAIMYMSQVRDVFGEGVGYEDVEINAVLMAEYGSGVGAKTPSGMASGVLAGPGTFPGQTHVPIPGSWYYITSDKKYHFSTGLTPRSPMQKAYEQLKLEADEVAQRIFR